jgi:O-antigen/teichoic acid export membrane protein
MNGGLFGVFVAYLVATVAGTSWLLWLSRRCASELQLAPWRQAPLHLLRGQFSRILWFVFHTNLIGTSRILSSRADILLLGWLTTPADVGLYRLAKTAADYLSVALAPIYKTVYPELSRLVSQQQYRMVRSLQRKLSLLLLVVIVPGCLLLTLLAPRLIPLVFGQEYVEAVPLVQILAWQILWMILIWFPGWMLALERTRAFTILNWVDAIVYVGLLLLWIPVAGTYGAAYATVARYVIWTILALWLFVRINRTLS